MKLKYLLSLFLYIDANYKANEKRIIVETEVLPHKHIGDKYKSNIAFILQNVDDPSLSGASKNQQIQNSDVSLATRIHHVESTKTNNNDREYILKCPFSIAWMLLGFYQERGIEVN